MKRILIYADFMDGKIFQSLSYLNLVYPYGIPELINPYSEITRALDADILLIPGGADIDPMRYGERPGYYTGRANNHYEWMDNFFLPEWIKTKKPIIGICRGMQSLNVALGGTLHQHLIGHQSWNKDRSDPEHKMYTDILDKKEGIDFRIHEVNSFHHQGVKDIAPGMQVLGWSMRLNNCPSLYGKDTFQYTNHYYYRLKETKKINRSTQEYFALPEIIAHEELPYIGFQYHPEDMNCPLFHYLVQRMLGLRKENPEAIELPDEAIQELTQLD